MGLFDRFKKTEEPIRPPIARTSVFDTELPIDRSDLTDVYSACLGPSLAIQEACRTHVVKNRGWNVDFRSGQLSFGKDSYPVQLIGSESSVSDTWKWGWDNVNNLDERFVALAHELRAWGETHGLEVLTTSDLILIERISGHTMGILACGLSEGNYAYYRAPHDGGAVLLAFSELPDIVFQPLGLQRFITLVVEALENHIIDHRIFIEAFLHWNQTPYRRNEDTIEAEFDQQLIVNFETIDGQRRVAEMKLLSR